MKNVLKETFNTKDDVNDIISQLDNHIGLNNAKEVLQNIEKYFEVYGIKTVEQYKDYNIIISLRSEYTLYLDLIKIIRQLYILLGIISKDSKCLYVHMNNNANNFLLKDIKNDEEIIIIDMLDYEDSYSNIKYKIDIAQREQPKKIYIILENSRRGKTNALFINDFQWYININEISNEDKEKYIKDFLLKHKIKSNDIWIKNLSNEPYYNVKNKLTNVLVQCKINNKFEIFEKPNDTDKSNPDKSKTGLEELNELIGLETVKDQILKTINYLKICKDRKNMPMLHMCFNGNPGTGKTTVARILGKIFVEEKILSQKNNFVEVQRADLIGKYVGHTAPLTNEHINKARGGILFIDEAYSLSSYIEDEAGRDFGAECIATLIKGMEDYRDEMCVILAGYTKEMNHLLQANPGFESRIQFKIEFPDYSKEDLYKIFKQLCQKEKYTISATVENILLEHFEVSRNKSNFSNARYVRNLFEKIKIEQANRVIKTCKNKNSILKIDVQNVINNIIEKKEPIRKMGFTL